MSLSARFLAYLLLLHALFAGVAFLLLRGSRVWLLAVEAVFAVSFLFGLALLRGLRRGLQPLEEASRLLAESDFTTRFRDVGQPEVDRLIADVQGFCGEAPPHDDMTLLLVARQPAC